MTLPQTAILQIDGRVAGSVRNVEGGGAKTSIVNEPAGHENRRIKHTSVVDIDPISLEVGSGSKDMVQWMAATMRKEFARRNFAVFSKNYEIDGFEALISEITMPALNRDSSADVFMKIKIQLERQAMKKSAGRPQHAPPVSGLSGSEFLFTIAGVLTGGKEVRKVDSFTIKEGIKKFYSGTDRLPQIEPTKIEFPHLVITLPEARAEKLLEWHEQATSSTVGRPDVEKSGRLEFFSSGKSKAFAVELSNLGIVSVAKSGNGQITTELYCGAMDIDG